MQEKKQEIYKIHCFYMGKIKKNDNLIIKDLMSSYKSRDLGFKISFIKKLNFRTFLTNLYLDIQYSILFILTPIFYCV